MQKQRSNFDIPPHELHALTMMYAANTIKCPLRRETETAMDTVEPKNDHPDAGGHGI